MALPGFELECLRNPLLSRFLSRIFEKSISGYQGYRKLEGAQKNLIRTTVSLKIGKPEKRLKNRAEKIGKKKMLRSGTVKLEKDDCLAGIMIDIYSRAYGEEEGDVDFEDALAEPIPVLEPVDDEDDFQVDLAADMDDEIVDEEDGAGGLNMLLDAIFP